MPDIMPEHSDDEAVLRAAGLAADQLAARPLDTIAVPLLAPLARLLMKLDLDFWEPGERERLSADLDLLDADPGLETSAARVAAARAGEFALVEGAELYGPVADGWLERDPALAPLAQVRELREWMKETEPHVALAALAASALSVGAKADAVARANRDLFHYARAHGAGDWGSAHRLAQAYWAEPAHREELLLGAWLASREDADVLEEIVAEALAEKEALAAERKRVAPLPPPRPPGPRLTLMYQQESPELDTPDAGDDRVAELQHELAIVRAAGSKARARCIALDKEMGPLREERDRAVRNASMLRALLTEAREAAPVADAAPAEPVDDAWPAALLAGIRIALFTGQKRGAAREAMAEQLRLVGAEVSVYDGNAKSAGPERFQPGTVVVCDVRFMSHPSAHRIRDRAARSDVRCVELGNGQGGLVRAVARALERGR